uniref:Capsid protein n=1 Tax=Cressdnavirus D_HF4_1386 TaxID=3071199 RepID=A0AA50Q5U6_9VIRU|nr:capsid protein [Cressdnavirus D_HF4_1386]
MPAIPAKRSWSNGRAVYRRKAAGYGGTARRPYKRQKTQPSRSFRSKRAAPRRRAGNSQRSSAGQSGLTRSFRKRSSFMKGFKKVLAPQYLNTVTQSQVRANVSRQGVTLFQAYTGSTGVSTPYLMQGTVDLADCQEILASTEPTAATQGSLNNFTGRTRRMQLMHCKAKYTIKNQTNVPVEMWLYDCVLRRDSTGTIQGPDTDWVNGLADEAVSISGVTNANAQQGLLPGQRPFESQLFCQRWKVSKVTKFVLDPGREHIHYVTIKPSGLLNNELLRSYNGLRGLTTTVMPVVKGGLVQDTTTPFNITYGPAEVDCITEVQYKFTALEKSRSAYTQYSSLPNALTNLGTILPDTDAVANVQVV